MFEVKAINDYNIVTRFRFGCVEPAEKLTQVLSQHGFNVAYTTTESEDDRSAEEKERAQQVLATVFEEIL